MGLSVKITVEGATKMFNGGAVVAFEGLSLEVRTQEILCILGPSGCGKTTLLRSMNGLLPLDRGRILIDDTVVESPRPSVAMVFQHFGLFPWKRLDQNVGYGLKIQGWGKEEARRTVAYYVKMMGLEGFEHHFPYQLSGGMQQRAGLARALAISPDVLLLDEPFGSVDAQTREILQEELLRIWDQERKTMVFVTHSIDEAILLGDRVAVMTTRPGRVREILPIDLSRPRSISQVRSHPRFIEARNYLWDLLKREPQA